MSLAWACWLTRVSLNLGFGVWLTAAHGQLWFAAKLTANNTVDYRGRLNLRLPGFVLRSLAVSFLSNTWDQMLWSSAVLKEGK